MSLASISGNPSTSEHCIHADVDFSARNPNKSEVTEARGIVLSQIKRALNLFTPQRVGHAKTGKVGPAPNGPHEPFARKRALPLLTTKFDWFKVESKVPEKTPRQANAVILEHVSVELTASGTQLIDGEMHQVSAQRLGAQLPGADRAERGRTRSAAAPCWAAR
jgi:hypothetical protein